MAELTCRVREEADRILLSMSGFEDCFFDFPSGGKPVLECHDFAVWAALSLAMKRGLDIRVEGPVSARAARSAEAVSDIWNKLMPYEASRVRVSSAVVLEDAPSATKRLSFFSGGVDSTHAVQRAFDVEGEKTTGLTIHGADYSLEEPEKFDAMVLRLSPLTDRYFDAHLIVRTNLKALLYTRGAKHRRNNTVHTTLAFAVGSIFGHFREYRIAADYTDFQHLVVSPNHSNPPIVSRMLNWSGGLRPMDLDVGRTQKVRNLLETGFDFSTLSVCQVPEAQPGNCGRCEKCMKTKANLIAATGEIPKIFDDMSFGSDWHRNLDLRFASDRAFYADVMSFVEDQNEEGAFPGYGAMKRRYEEELYKMEYSALHNIDLRTLAKELTPDLIWSGARKLRSKLRR